MNKSRLLSKQCVSSLKGLRAPALRMEHSSLSVPYILLIRMQSVCVFESHFQCLLLPSLSTCLQQRWSSLSWCLQQHFAQVSQYFSHILLKLTLKLLPNLLENMSKSYAVTCKCKYVQLLNLPQGFIYSCFYVIMSITVELSSGLASESNFVLLS